MNTLMSTIFYIKNITYKQIIMDKWWEKLDKTRHGRPYSELNEGLIYYDFILCQLINFSILLS